MRDGVIYVATGEDYLSLARQSALSLRQTNPGLAVDLFTDLGEAGDLGMFDQVHPVPRVHPRVKLECLPLSRFERTLYLDCDTLVLAPLGSVFDLVERFDLALAHDVRRRSDLVREGLELETPYAFPQLNSGVMLYRRSEAMRLFLAEWLRRYMESGLFRDQIVLKDLLWQSDLRFYVLPPEFNLRRVTMLDAWEPLDARPTILHSHRLMDHMRNGGPRVTTLQQVLDLERLALAQEWHDTGLAPGDRRQAERLLSVMLEDTDETRQVRKG
ncbi:MAG: hypothetical protein HUJ27_06220 [Rhodobacteraceae bacterium]|nr:hypothetical protein [Paracoccaceae bacterium]